MKTKPTAIVMIALGALMNLCLGAVYSYSVFRIPLEKSLEIDPSVSGYPYMVFLAMFALTMPFAGFLLERIGPRRTALLGGTLVASGWLLAGFSGSIIQVTLAYGVLGGIGVGIAYGVPLALAARWFPDRPGLAAGITLLGFGMSPLITAPLSEIIIEQLGVLTAFRTLGIGFAAVIWLCALPMHVPTFSHAEAGTADGLGSKAMLKTPRFWGLWICFTLGTVVGLTAIGITSPVAQSAAGLSAGAAATAVSIMAIANGLGRPLFGMLTDHIGIRKSAQAAFAIIAAASGIMLLLWQLSDAAPALRVLLFALGFALFWLVLGGWLAIAPAATTQLFGRYFYSRNYGFVYTAYGAGAIIGTVASGALYDIFGGYQPIFLAMLAVGILGVALSAALLPTKRPVAAAA